jgi:uncharacterized protein (DUF1330 family)
MPLYLRFREVADYAEHPDLAPVSPISGAEAYQRCGEAAQVHLGEVGASVEYFASCGPTVIGPEGERWDMILLVRYPNPAAFLAMVNKPEYQTLAGHRAVSRSRRRPPGADPSADSAAGIVRAVRMGFSESRATRRSRVRRPVCEATQSARRAFHRAGSGAGDCP